ncbi:MAG: hypothetical protein PVF43_01660 [Candidatus Eiseniibacteriota bacterium]|jgi:hypothetical protein
MRESERVLFEIYADRTYHDRYRVVYYTELGERNRDTEIARALAGEHFCDGFIPERRRFEAKQVIEAFVERLNRGEGLRPGDLEQELGGLAVGP